MSLQDELDELEQNKHRMIPVLTPYSGVVSFIVRNKATNDGDKVEGPNDDNMQIGSALYMITRQGAPEIIRATADGVVANRQIQYHDKQVEALTQVMQIQHPLTKKEVLSILLEKRLEIMRAPETAVYGYSPELVSKLKAHADGQCIVNNGDRLVTQDRMKSEIMLPYEGKKGILYEIYFNKGERVHEKEPLVGICPPELVDEVARIAEYVNVKWKVG